MIKKSLMSAAAFTPDLLQSPSAWLGHLPFAAWVIHEVSPKIFVELGTHYGHSYFAFCQSVVEASISTKCYAVDTWQGDEHAGEYSEDIFTKVNGYHEEKYANFSRLLRMTFNNAVNYFSDESIDLLHIDGLHTYEAVRDDFYTWLPKLAPGAVVIFHDINVKERDFGVWKFWEELQVQYENNIEFVHSHGLGVLQLNVGQNQKKLQWLQPESTDKQILINYFASLGSRQLERAAIRDLHLSVASLNKAIFERDVQISNFKQAVLESNMHINNLKQAVQESEDQIVGLSQSLLERETQIDRLNHDAKLNAMPLMKKLLRRISI